MSNQVVLLNANGEPIAFHEEKRHESLARMLAEIKGAGFGGKYNPAASEAAGLYFVPHYTVVGTDAAGSFGIRTADDLFGGVVPKWFLGTKAIVHDVIGSRSVRPDGWESGFSHAVSGHVLPGFTAFDLGDACEAGKKLFESGPVRVKDVFAAGGLGQVVVRNAAELKKLLDGGFASEGPEFSVVLEADLADITTFSVGHVYVDGMTLSYWGTQRTTEDNFGNTAYGGSDLTIVRGGFDAVIAIAPTEETARAVLAAQTFDEATLEHYPGIFASRRNYDVAVGHDHAGTLRCGVIDQSWRIGGTSGVEVAALRIFKERPDVKMLKGSSFNVYGSEAVAPPNAIVHYHGDDSEAGPLLMYTVIEIP